MNLLTFTLASLATFRLARLFADESGPASIFTHLRRRVPPKTNAGRGIRCPFCWSVWCGAVITAFLWWVNEVPAVWVPLYAFALSGASVFIHVWQAD